MSDTAPRTDYPHGRRGFAAMSREQVTAIASLGGKTAHRIGKAHEWTPETAREAGRKGGKASAETKRQQRAARRAA